MRIVYLNVCVGFGDNSATLHKDLRLLCKLVQLKIAIGQFHFLCGTVANGEKGLLF